MTVADVADGVATAGGGGGGGRRCRQQAWRRVGVKPENQLYGLPASMVSKNPPTTAGCRFMMVVCWLLRLRLYAVQAYLPYQASIAPRTSIPVLSYALVPSPSLFPLTDYAFC
jgi:hypothetical protein